MKKKTKLFTFFILLSFYKVAIAQVTFQKTFYGEYGSEGYSVQQTSDEGYIIAGAATQYYASGIDDIYLIKTDKKGNVLWTKYYGGTDADVAYSVQQTTNDGYIIAGSTASFGAGSWDVYLIKTDENGNVIWSKTYGGTEDDRCYSACQTTDGGYILTGTTASFEAGYYDIYVIKTDDLGNIVWSKTFGGAGGDYSYSVQETTDGGFIITGDTQSFGPDSSTDVYLIKIDSEGNILWSRTFGGTTNDGGVSVCQTMDGGYIITGFTVGFLAYPKSDFYIIKTDNEGNISWSKTYGGARNDYASSIQQTLDGGYIISGNITLEIDGVYNGYLIKILYHLK